MSASPGLDRVLERFQPDWNKTRPRPSLIVSCYPWISTPEGWLGVSSQDENALAKPASPSRRGRRSAPRDIAARLEAAFRTGAADAIQQAHQAGLAVPVLDKADSLVWI